MIPRFKALLCTPIALTLLCLPVVSHSAPDEAILLIDQTSGVAGIQRNGKRLALQAGDALQEQDLIVTDRSGRMTLRLGRHGFVEVGPNAEVGVERLPFAAYARDLKSIFSVSRGYFRVVWKHPQLSSTWPLYVYMAGHRISLVSGEYFFQNLGSEQRACVAAGQIALQASGGEGLETIKPPSCVTLAVDKPPQTVPRSPDDWIAVRRGFSIEATAGTLLAREMAPAESIPPPAAKPVINTAPAAMASVPPPTAIPAAQAPVVDEPLLAEPQVSNSAAAALPLGPVRAAPVLPAPAGAPRTVVAPALPVYEPLIYPPPSAAPPLATTSPVIIGQVQAAPANPAIKPLPAPPPVTAKPAGGSVWALNIASYSEAAVAEREAARLRAAGYASALSQPATINGKSWHRVQIGGYASESSARAAALELKTKLGVQNIWVLKP
ncbi:MAG: SPOR domain-containing protein [Pseudomonadota bacterium]